MLDFVLCRSIPVCVCARVGPVAVCCTWLEEPAASGSVTKDLIRDGRGEGEGRQEEQTERLGIKASVSGCIAGTVFASHLDMFPFCHTSKKYPDRIEFLTLRKAA